MKNEGFHSVKAQMARKDVCWGGGWNVRVATAILKVNEPNCWIESIIRGLGLLRHVISTPIMIYNGLRWVGIKNIKGNAKRSRDARRKKQAKAKPRASDAGKGSGYDFRHGRRGGAFSWFKQ